MSVALIFPFTTSTDYTYDSSKVEITGGAAALKSQIPTGATCGATYNSNINLNWGGGTLTGTAAGGATVSGGKLDCTGGSRYVTYSATGNADSAQTGAVKFKYTPNYSGSPVGAQKTLFTIWQSAISNANVVTLYHNTSGNLAVSIYSSSGTLIRGAGLGVWAPVSGTEYEFELNWDCTAGAHRLFVNGVQFGITLDGTGTRSTAATTLSINAEQSATFIGDAKYDSLMVYSAVQHTANYTPGYTTPTKYVTDDPTVEANTSWLCDGLDAFTETLTATGTDAARYVLKKGSEWYYYTGSAWAISAGTYATASTAAQITAGKATFATTQTTCKVKAFLHSGDGSTTPSLSELEIDYNFAGETADTISKCIVWGYNYDETGAAISGTVSACLNTPAAKYKTKTILYNSTITDTIDATGYWELELAETSNMTELGTSYTVKYIFTINGRSYERSVPNEISKNFLLLT